jgi:ferredoxin
MIRSITQKKPAEEIERLLKGLNRIFIIGCGTCVTLTHTGGEPEVRELKKDLSEKGKLITGTTVVPVACDNLTREFLGEFGEQIKQSDALLITSCAFGVQTIARQLKKMVVPAVNTMFIGKETAFGTFDEICTQCGTCIIGETGGICPVTNCHKGLVNGPCGGTNHGKCEIDVNKDCVWTLIYKRLTELDRLDSMRTYQKPRNHLGEPKPGKLNLEAN